MRKLHVKQEHALRYDDPMSMVLLAWRMCVVADSTPVPDDAAFNITTAMTIAAAREYGGVKLARALAPSCGLIDQLVTALSTVAGIYTSQAGVSERIAMLVTSGCWLARTLNEFVPTRAQHAAITTAYIMGRKDTCSEFTGFLARHDPASLVELDECVEELADARRCATNIVATITKGIKEADPAVVDMMGVAMNTQSRMVWWSRLLGQCANAKDVNETNVHITCIDAAVNPCKRNVDLVVHMLVVLPMRDVNLLMHMIAATRAEAVVWDEEEVGPAAASPTPAKKVYKTKRAKLNAKGEAPRGGWGSPPQSPRAGSHHPMNARPPVQRPGRRRRVPRGQPRRHGGARRSLPGSTRSCGRHAWQRWTRSGGTTTRRWRRGPRS